MGSFSEAALQVKKNRLSWIPALSFYRIGRRSGLWTLVGKREAFSKILRKTLAPPSVSAHILQHSSCLSALSVFRGIGSVHMPPIARYSTESSSTDSLIS
jgi:hypothetical protein